MLSEISNCVELNKMSKNVQYFKCISWAFYWIQKIHTVYGHSLFLSSLTEHGVDIKHMRKTRAQWFNDINSQIRKNNSLACCMGVGL